MKQYIDLIDKVLNEATNDYDKTKLQPALMTRSEYISHRNPRGKMHSSDAYKTTIDSLNQDYSLSLNRQGGMLIVGGERYTLLSNEQDGKELYLVLKSADNKDDIEAFAKDGVLYYDPMRIRRDDAVSATNADYHDLEIQPVKYIEPLFKRLNLKSQIDKYPKPIKNITIDGEQIRIRQADDKFGDIAAFNEDDMKVAVGQDEWGAVLVMVADEYRGKGIGPIMQKIYTELYPDKESGGFTPSGLNNATKVWEREVRRFLASGIYSNLIRKGEISKERVDDILSGLSGKVDFKSNLPKKVPQKEKDYMVYYNGANAFILYDKDYLLDHDLKYIYAYIHLEQKPTAKDNEVYVFRFEYESDKDRQTLFHIAIQQMESEGVTVREDEAGSDYFKYNDMKHIEVKDGVFKMNKKPFSNLKMLYSKEKQLRNQIDKYNEVLYNLLEDAERKWR